MTVVFEHAGSRYTLRITYMPVRRQYFSKGKSVVEERLKTTAALLSPLLKGGISRSVVHNGNDKFSFEQGRRKALAVLSMAFDTELNTAIWAAYSKESGK